MISTELDTFLKSGLLILVPVLYFIGNLLKKSPFRDEYIPTALTISGIILSGIYLLAIADFKAFDAFEFIFDTLTQGVIAAACAVYAKNIIKQSAKTVKGGKENDRDNK